MTFLSVSFSFLKIICLNNITCFTEKPYLNVTNTNLNSSSRRKSKKKGEISPRASSCCLTHKGRIKLRFEQFFLLGFGYCSTSAHTCKKFLPKVVIHLYDNRARYNSFLRLFLVLCLSWHSLLLLLPPPPPPPLS